MGRSIGDEQAMREVTICEVTMAALIVPEPIGAEAIVGEPFTGAGRIS
jgi:hypothetical protein